MSSVLAVVPCRYDSTRLPGKPLADICGAPMIVRVCERCRKAAFTRVVVATDDERIHAAVKKFGFEVAMTRADHPDGTSRVAEVAASSDADYVVNVQGDEPLVDPRALDELVAGMTSDPDVVSATLCTEMSSSAKLADPNVVKLVRRLNGDALYFSRSPIPYERASGAGAKIFEHIGIYGFKRDFLLRFASLPPTPLASAESLEQLKILEHGWQMRVIETRYPSAGPNVNTPEDLEEVRRIYAEVLK